jgi:gp6-like head-tail connector protein
VTWEPDYVTLPEVKSYLRIGDIADDAQLGVWITTASRAVDAFCHRQFGQTAAPELRRYATTWDRIEGVYYAQIDDLQTIAGLIVLDASATVLTSYTLLPYNALQKGKPYERISTSSAGPLAITGSWGWTSVPVPVKSATLLQVSRFAARRDSPYGIAGSPGDGSEMRLLASLDPDVKTSLGSKYRREWWAA